MKKEYWLTSFKITLAYLNLKLLYFLLDYYYRFPFLSSFLFISIFFFVKIIGMIVLLKYLSPDIINYTKHTILTLFLTITVCSVFDTSITILFHHYIDIYYKEEIVERQVEKQVEKIREIEREKKVSIKSNFDSFREDRLKSYEIENILISLLKLIPVNIILALILGKIISKKEIVSY